MLREQSQIVRQTALAHIDAQAHGSLQIARCQQRLPLRWPCFACLVDPPARIIPLRRFVILQLPQQVLPFARIAAQYRIHQTFGFGQFTVCAAGRHRLIHQSVFTVSGFGVRQQCQRTAQQAVQSRLLQRLIGQQRKQCPTPTPVTHAAITEILYRATCWASGTHRLKARRQRARQRIAGLDLRECVRSARKCKRQ